MTQWDGAEPAAGGEPASLHLEAALAPRGGSTLAKTGRVLVTIAVSLVAGTVEGPSETDLVVRRRDSGNEILRVSAGSVEEADRLLQIVRRDLRTKTVTEFVADWRTP